MQKQLAALIIAALAATTAHANDSGGYFGLALARPGNMDAVSRTGKLVESEHSGFAGRLYGGYGLNQNLAFEAGYASYGTFTLPGVGLGTSGDAHVRPASVYAGVKGIYHVGEKLELFGKLILVHTRFDLAGLGAEDESINRVMPGVGAEYRVTPRLGLTLELTRYGNANVPRVGRLNLNRLEAGLNVRF